MNIARTVVVSDPLARANVVAALAGPGAPVGIDSCTTAGAAITVSFDPQRTAPDLVDALIAIESVYVPAKGCDSRDLAAAIALAAAGLAEPALDSSRIIETYLT